MSLSPLPLLLSLMVLAAPAAAARAAAATVRPESPRPMLISDAAADAARRAGMGCFGVARAGGGTATVVVTRPDGRKRSLFFLKGVFSSADTTRADGAAGSHGQKHADTYHVNAPGWAAWQISMKKAPQR